MATYEQELAAEYVSSAYLALTSGEGREVRKKARMTLRETAAIIGLDYSLLSKWERKESFPSQQNQLRYARALEKMREKAGAVA